MTLRTSLVISGDATGATEALTVTETGLDKAKPAAVELADALDDVTVATKKTGKAQADLAIEAADAKSAITGTAVALEQLDHSAIDAASSVKQVSVAQEVATAIARQTAPVYDAVAVSGQHVADAHASMGASGMILQHVVRSTTDSFVAGLPISMIFGEQIGRLGEAAALSGGAMGKFGAFMAGPYGLAVSAAIGITAALAPTLFSAGEAADKASDDVLNLSGSFSSLAHNALIAKTAMKEFFDSLPKASALATAADAETKTMINAMGTSARLARQIEAAKRTAQIGMGMGMMGAGASSQVGNLQEMKDKADKQVSDSQKKLAQLRSDAAAAAVAAQKREDLDAIAKAEGKKPPKPKKEPKGKDLVKIGEDDADRIARISDQFSEIPGQVLKTNNAMRDLDKIGRDIARNKLPDAGPLNAQLEATKQLVQDSLNKPFNDYIKAQRESAEVDKLLVAGRDDEAEALKVILGLQKQQGPLSEAQQQAVLANVASERKLNDELRNRQQIIGNYLDATRSVRSEIEAIFAGQGKLSNFGEIFKRLQAQVQTEQVFGPIFRGLEDYVKHNTFGPAVDDLTDNTKRAGTVIGQLADTMQDALKRLAGPASVAASGGLPAVDGTGTGQSPQGGTGSEQDHANEEIVVTAIKRGTAGSTLALSPDAYFQMMFAKLTAPITDQLDAKLGTTFFSGLNSVLSGALSGFVTAGPAGGLLGALKGIKGLPEGITAGLGKALGGAQTGTLVSGVANAVGIKLSQTGAQIGGALGSFLPIPGGQIIGSIVGGLLGGLFNKAKTGGASVGLNQYGQAGVTGTGGNNATLKGNANSLGGTISQGLNQIAQQLGASLGQFSVAIGMRNDYYRVSASGSIASATTKHYSSDVIYDGKDQAQAVSVALANAIADGAIQGISARVQLALKSSTDIDQALREALKVQDLELALGGIGATLKKAFSDFELQAKERLRVAGQYGFDVVAVEKKNADDRLALQKKLVADQIGSLQQLIDDMTTGSLFEGSAVDQAQAIRDQIVAVKAEVDAGTAGAADKLANLLNQLNSVSKDAYGTTGGFAADRSTILDTARDSIAKANQRVADAQAATDPALAETNAALDENNAQNAQMLAALGLTNTQLATLIGRFGSTGAAGLAALARTSL